MEERVVKLPKLIIFSLAIFLLNLNQNVWADTTAIQLVYTRADDPKVHIVINSPNASIGGLSSIQIGQLWNLLNHLPAANLQGVTTITWLPPGPSGSGTGSANPNGTIDLDMTLLSPTAIGGGWAWQADLMHEIGHEVEFRVISQTDRAHWVALHNASNDPLNFVPNDDNPGYAQTDEEEDFAETHRWYAEDTGNLFSMAVNNAAAGHTLLLAKALFMTYFFVNPNGTVNFYTPGIQFTRNGPNPDIVSSTQTISTVSQIPYVKTADMLQIDGYTFTLVGQNTKTITRITDANGNIVADNISVPLYPPFWPLVTTASPSNPNPAPTPQPTPPSPRNPRTPSPEISVGPDSSAGSIETVVGGGPDNYVPLTAARANSQLRNLQVNGIRAGDSAGTAVHGGVVVRQRGTNQPTSDGPTIVGGNGGGPDVITLP
jgi:hypothetical protein